MKKPTCWVRITGASLCVVLAGSPLGAGEPPSRLEPGARVRVEESSAGSPRFGAWEGLREGQLLLRIDDASLRIPLSAVRRVDVSRGRKLSKKGGILGAAVGGAVGAVAMGCLANKDDYGVACAGQDDTKYVVGALVGGLVGGALGALIGRRERWEPVDIHQLGAPGDAGPTR